MISPWKVVPYTVLGLMLAARSALGASAPEVKYSLDQLARWCQDPDRNGLGLPEKFTLTCETSLKSLEPSSESLVADPNTTARNGVMILSSRDTTATLTGIHYPGGPLGSLRPEHAQIEYPVGVDKCMRMTEVETSVKFEIHYTCGEVQRLEGSATEICLRSVGEAVKKDPKLLDTHPTGKITDICPEH